MCWKCGSSITEAFISRTSECPVCGKDLHSCRNCVFYSPGSHYDCHESIDELVKDKESANFCDSFSVKRNFSGNSSANLSENSTAQKARDAFNSLFNN